MRASLVVFSLAGLSACGGGGGGGGPDLGRNTANSGTGYVAGTYMPSAQFQSQCAKPRSGIDPTTGVAYLDRSGTVLAEQLWQRSWSNELYLWYSEIPDLNPSTYSVSSYFDALKTPLLTSTGARKDKFHFTYATSDWVALSQSGTQAGYGAEWALVALSPPRKALVAFTEPTSPAVTAGLMRGTEIISVDGASISNGNAGILNAGLFPASAGEVHTFVVLDPGASVSRSVTLVAANVTSTPVQNVRTVSSNGSLVGYLLFNDHIATAESQLIAAINQLRTANVNNTPVDDLVLDIRYNGGGYLDIASELAYMIAGSARTSGLTFERVQFNSKYAASTNPVTNELLEPTPFHNMTQGFAGTAVGQPLPTLNLSTVYVLTSAGTCSASEAVINGLRGVGVQVVQIGSTTCGKPYGFYPQDNCGTTYFTIEFRGVNAVGFGDYTDGFSPQNSSVRTNATLPGCSVADDFTHALGDPLEARFAAALNYRMNPTCPVASGAAPRATPMGVDRVEDTSSVDGVLQRPQLRDNRWYQ
jgi:C-terminal processing protease CtpA/Prc